MAGDERIQVGVVGAPHGVAGEVRLKSFTGDPLAVGGYGPLLSEDGRQRFTLVKLRPVRDDMLVARFEGVGTREAAAALTGTRLFVERAALPPAEEDEFYHADLIGLRAEGHDGTVLGHVTAMANYGGGDLLEIRPPRGDAILVPFLKAFVPVVDLAEGRVVLSAEALDDGAPDPEAPPLDPLD